ncbi:MAG: hypothetical protein Q4D71_08900 [Oscillospiraceae bacterium]|nr:hypothetical protein [Oscillospiraceae bacterium]
MRVLKRLKLSGRLKRTEEATSFSKIWRCMFLAVLFSVSCYIGFMLSNPLYLSTDSIGVSIVVDGYYGANNFCQYIHPLLCLLIRCLTPVIPSADVFTLLTHVVIGIQIGTLFLLFTDKILANSIKSWAISSIWIIFTTGMTILLFTSGITIWNANYTITTGAIVLFGLIICFVSEREHRSLSWVIIGSATLCFGCMLRMESALLFFPFVALDVVARYFSIVTGTEVRDDLGDSAVFNYVVQNIEPVDVVQQMRKYRRLHKSRLLPIALIIILLFITRVIFYTQEPYRTAVRYNAARTVCVDFPMKTWAPEVEDELGRLLSANDYAAATDWCFMDTDFLDTEMFERIADAGKKNKYEVSASGIKGMLNEMKYTLFHSSLYMVILVILSAALAIHNILNCGIWRKGETLLAILGAFVIIMYFTFRGRAPMRVWEPVIFATDFNLLMAAQAQHPARTVHDCFKTKSKIVEERIFGICVFITLWFSTGQLIANGSFHEPQPVWMSRVPVEHSIYEATVSDLAGEDALFIWPNWNAHLPEEVKITGKLPSLEMVRHNIAFGDWVYGQPYFTKFLRSIDAENPAAALLNRPNTFFMEPTDIVKTYMQEHGLRLTEKNAYDWARYLYDSGTENLLIVEKSASDEYNSEWTDMSIVFEPVPELGRIEDGYAYKVKVISEKNDLQ